MLTKRAGDQSAVVLELERLLAGNDPEAKRASARLRIRKAGLKGKRESPYLIHADYAKSTIWAVIHDLRLELGGGVAQIDHMLIDRQMNIYGLQTDHFDVSPKIRDHCDEGNLVTVRAVNENAHILYYACGAAAFIIA